MSEAVPEHNNLTMLFEWRHTRSKISRADLETWLNEWGKYWGYQVERGDTGYEHYQGVICLEKRRRPSEIKKLMLDAGFLTERFQPLCNTVAKTIRNADCILEGYCGKRDTRIEGPFKSQKASEQQYWPKQYRNKELNDWQDFVYQVVKEETEEADSRSIHWVYDWWGKHGKSVLTNVLRLQGNAIMIPPINDSKELLQAFCDQCIDREIRSPGAVFIDLPRAFPADTLRGIVSAMEAIKDGWTTDTRHRFKSWDCDTPSVWLFANCKPPPAALSNDRLNLWMFTTPYQDAELAPYEEGSENVDYPGYKPPDIKARQRELVERLSRKRKAADITEI